MGGGVGVRVGIGGLSTLFAILGSCMIFLPFSLSSRLGHILWKFG